MSCVSRHQFPQPPTPLGKGRIPAWQQSVSLPAQVPLSEEEPLAVVNGQGESSDDADRDDEGLKDEG